MADNNKKYKGLILVAILIALAAFSSSSAISGLANFTINVSGYPGQPGIDSNVTLICEGNTTCTSDNANHSILITSTGGGGAGNGLTNQSVNPYSMNAVNLTGKIPYTSLNASLCNPANQFSVFNQNTFNFDCVASPGADDDYAYVPYTGANQNVDLGGFDINSSNSKSTTVSTNTIVPNNNNFPLEVWSPSGSYPYPPSHSFHTSYQNEGAYFVYRECDPFCTNYNKSFQNNIEYSLYEDLNMNGNNILNSPSISTFNQTYDNYQQVLDLFNQTFALQDKNNTNFNNSQIQQDVNLSNQNVFVNKTFLNKSNVAVQAVGGGTSTTSIYTNQIWYVKVIPTANFGSIFNLSVNIQAIGGGGHIRAAIYSDNAGSPGTRLTETESKSAVVGFNYFTITNATILSSTTYWLASNADSNNIVAYFDVAGGGNYQNLAYGAFPGTATPVSSIYHINMKINGTTNDLSGSGNALACLDSSGNFYRGSASSC